MPRWERWAVSLGVVAVDQGVKAWAVSALAPGEIRPLLGEFLRLTRVHNPGAAFGIFPQGTAAFLVASVLVAFGLIAYLLLGRPSGLRGWGSALILGGTLGNLIDRARLGWVVDLFSVGNFPVFNVADVALVLGVGLLALGLVRGFR
ncbi:signal peptidase II [Candidatus Bipolaricaulota bacterium]|nr:signal peptidase II [Candidatus Bipolaricaulota bacterium]